MSLKTLVKGSIQKAECELKGHNVPKEKERELFSGKGTVDAICERCSAPIELRKLDNERYIIDEL